jgi:phospholipid/cholesterol/gamma-HCH transport system permease protein
VSLIFAAAVQGIARRPLEVAETIRQIERVGISSLTIVSVTSTVMGMVMATQFAFGLQKFGGMDYTPRVIAVSFAQELAPTFIGIIVAGRVGSGIAAELGAMAVTEQISAIAALGADPIKKLVTPRLVACVVVMPLLGALSLVLGFSAAMLMTDLQFGIAGSYFLSSALQSLTLEDYLSGAIKTPVFGAIIALTACHFGMSTRGGTLGVGTNTTNTVVVTAIAILIADFLLTQLGYVIWPMR